MLSSRFDSFVQLFTVLFVFLLVLVLAYVTTVYIARIQKTQFKGRNIEVIETCKLTVNKYIQIVRTGEKYYAIAVCKDTVTVLGELNKDEILFLEQEPQSFVDFQDILEKTKQKINKNRRGE